MSAGKIFAIIGAALATVFVGSAMLAGVVQGIAGTVEPQRIYVTRTVQAPPPPPITVTVTEPAPAPVETETAPVEDTYVDPDVDVDVDVPDYDHSNRNWNLPGRWW